MSERKKPYARSLPVLMDAALAVYLHVGDHVDEPGEYGASSNIYFDAHRCISYRTRWTLKTKAGAYARIRREAVQYLKDLRNQIDELLPRLEATEPDEHGTINVWSQAYEQPYETET